VNYGKRALLNSCRQPEFSVLRGIPDAKWHAKCIILETARTVKK
jgi:hypothetical protein